jgi:hypothetical protein
MTNFFKIRLYITGVVTIVIWGLLAWEYTHGGFQSHHILRRKDLPELQNWWGGILLPVLTWFLLNRIQKRPESILSKQVIYGFLSAFIIAVSIIVLVHFDIHDIPRYLLMSILIIALFYPIYRAECMLGFVLGMTFSFGAVLPIFIGSILAIIGFLIYNLIRPTVLYAVRFFKNSAT